LNAVSAMSPHSTATLLLPHMLPYANMPSFPYNATDSIAVT
jgi:hypothetical protein